jgi:hypothetical protein
MEPTTRIPASQYSATVYTSLGRFLHTVSTEDGGEWILRGVLAITKAQCRKCGISSAEIGDIAQTVIEKLLRSDDLADLWLHALCQSEELVTLQRIQIFGGLSGVPIKPTRDELLKCFSGKRGTELEYIIRRLQEINRLYDQSDVLIVVNPNMQTSDDDNGGWTFCGPRVEEYLLWIDVLGVQRSCFATQSLLFLKPGDLGKVSNLAILWWSELEPGKPKIYENAMGFLWRCVRNEVVEIVRKRRRNLVQVPDIECADLTEELIEYEARRSVYNRLENILRRRFPDEFKALKLRFIEDLSLADIAQRFGCTTATIRNRIKRVIGCPEVRALRHEL